MGKNFMGYNNASELLTAIGTKIKAKYTKPNTGIPKSDLATAVQTTLDQVVDEGAKNKFNPEKEILYGYVTDGNAYAFKSVIHDTRTVLTFVLLAYNNDTFVRELNSADIISTGLFSFTFVKGSDFNSLRFGHSGEVQDIKVYADVSDLVNGETYVLSFNATAINPSELIAWNSTMICTKAKWDVSHNFEPYTLPNYDLTVREAEDRAALAECVDDGAKNLWDFANANITAGGGADRITYTKTADSLTLTAVSTWAFVSYDIALKKGTYYFYGLISSLTGTDSKCVQIRVNGYQGTVIKRIDITANGAISDSFVVDTDRTITISLYVSEGEYTSSAFTISNLMICTEAAWNLSHNHESFALTNPVITSALIEQVDNGAKNLFNIFGATESVSSTTTRTINSDSTITVSNDGTNTSAASLTYTITLNANTQYVISGCPSGGSDSSYSLGIRNTSHQPVGNSVDYGSGSPAFTVPSTGTYLVYIRIAPEYSFSDKIFKPMICTEADWDVSPDYVPHRVPITGVFFASKKYVTSTTEISTGVKFTAPTAGVYKITATATYFAGKPTVLKVTQKHSPSENAYSFLYQESYTNSSALSVSGMMDLEAGGEFEVFTTYANETNNEINVVVEKIG